MENEIESRQFNTYDFNLKHGLLPPVSVDSIPIPTSDTVKYLGLTLDMRLTWKQHLRTKKNEF